MTADRCAAVPPLARAVRLSALAAALLGTAACTTLGGNVSGDFACRAPDGSCSPMSTIDARATEALIDKSQSAGPGRDPTQAMSLLHQSGTIGRSGERTLRIVFPAHVDGVGVLHDEAIAHVVVEPAAWAVTAEGRAEGLALPHSVEFESSRSSAPSSLREAVAGASAPAIEGLESLPAQAPQPLSGAMLPMRSSGTDMPTPEALAAARAGHRIAPPAASEPNSRPRALAAPALSQLGRPAGDELDGVFVPASGNQDPPK